MAKTKQPKTKEEMKAACAAIDWNTINWLQLMQFIQMVIQFWTQVRPPVACPPGCDPAMLAEHQKAVEAAAKSLDASLCCMETCCKTGE